MIGMGVSNIIFRWSALQPTCFPNQNSYNCEKQEHITISNEICTSQWESNMFHGLHMFPLGWKKGKMLQKSNLYQTLKVQ